MHGLFYILMIDISSLREPNLMFDISSHPHFDQHYRCFLPKLMLKICKLNAFLLKTGTAIIHMDSPFNISQYQLFLVIRIYFYIYKVVFYTSSKAYAIDICQHATDHKGVASVVYQHSYAKYDLPTTFGPLWLEIQCLCILPL